MTAYGPAVLRLCVGAVFMAHGAQKLFGIWDGAGLAGTAAFLARTGWPFPYPLAVLTAVGQFAGGALLIVGGLTRWVAVALMIDVGLAAWRLHYPNGFFLDAARGPGVEFGLVLIAALLCLTLTGPGALSFDDWRTSSAEAKAAGRARARKV
jgi:putative oxidoreductase